MFNPKRDNHTSVCTDQRNITINRYQVRSKKTIREGSTNPRIIITHTSSSELRNIERNGTGISLVSDTLIDEPDVRRDEVDKFNEPRDENKSEKTRRRERFGEEGELGGMFV